MGPVLIIKLAVLSSSKLKDTACISERYGPARTYFLELWKNFDGIFGSSAKNIFLRT